MRRLAATLALGGVLAFPAAAAAYPGESRNPTAVFGGPHCHFVGGTTKIAYPSHRAHLKQLAHGPAGAIFSAVPGDPQEVC